MVAQAMARQSRTGYSLALDVRHPPLESRPTRPWIGRLIEWKISASPHPMARRTVGFTPGLGGEASCHRHARGRNPQGYREGAVEPSCVGKNSTMKITSYTDGLVKSSLQLHGDVNCVEGSPEVLFRSDNAKDVKEPGMGSLPCASIKRSCRTRGACCPRQ